MALLNRMLGREVSDAYLADRVQATAFLGHEGSARELALEIGRKLVRCSSCKRASKLFDWKVKHADLTMLVVCPWCGSETKGELDRGGRLDDSTQAVATSQPSRADVLLGAAFWLSFWFLLGFNVREATSSGGAMATVGVLGMTLLFLPLTSWDKGWLSRVSARSDDGRYSFGILHVLMWAGSIDFLHAKLGLHPRLASPLLAGVYGACAAISIQLCFDWAEGNAGVGPSAVLAGARVALVAGVFWLSLGKLFWRQMGRVSGDVFGTGSSSGRLVVGMTWGSVLTSITFSLIGVAVGAIEPGAIAWRGMPWGWALLGVPVGAALWLGGAMQYSAWFGRIGVAPPFE